jgi:hypothetical protein
MRREGLFCKGWDWIRVRKQRYLVSEILDFEASKMFISTYLKL